MKRSASVSRNGRMAAVAFFVASRGAAGNQSSDFRNLVSMTFGTDVVFFMYQLKGFGASQSDKVPMNTGFSRECGLTALKRMVLISI